jgi:hypothetical protein
LADERHARVGRTDVIVLTIRVDGARLPRGLTDFAGDEIRLATARAGRRSGDREHDEEKGA